MPFVCFHNSIALYPHRRLFAATATVLPYLLGVGTRQLLHHSPLFREEETPAIKRTEVVCRRLYHHRKHNCYRNPLKETVVSPWSWCDKARRSTQQLPDPFFRSRSHLTSRSVAVMAASSSSTTATQAPPTAISTFGSLFENDLKTDKLCGDAGVAAGKRYQHNGYEYLLLDQWGVMHDGSTALAGAAECVARLKEKGKKIVILSNSSARAKRTIERLCVCLLLLCLFSLRVFLAFLPPLSLPFQIPLGSPLLPSTALPQFPRLFLTLPFPHLSHTTRPFLEDLALASTPAISWAQ